LLLPSRLSFPRRRSEFPVACDSCAVGNKVQSLPNPGLALSMELVAFELLIVHVVSIFTR
jgi:hypothetical protein